MCQQTHCCVAVSVCANQPTALPPAPTTTAAASPVHSCGTLSFIKDSRRRRPQFCNYGVITPLSRGQQQNGRVCMRSQRGEEGKRVRGVGGGQEGRKEGAHDKKEAWPGKDPRGKKQHLSFYLRWGRSEAPCHMTYPSDGAHRDTSIHLCRHLTCLKLGKKKREEKGKRRGG